MTRQMDNVFLVLFIILVCSVRAETSLSTDVAKIRSTILRNDTYDPIARPNDTVYVKAGFNVLYIYSMDIKHQSFEVIGWITLEWTDERTRWVPEDYDSKLEELHVLTSEIWKPEVIIDNSMANIGVISDDNLQLRVKYNGNVEWEPPGIFTTHCEADITYYPFDRQKCTIELTSWSHSKEQLELLHLSRMINIEDIRPNGEWILDRTEIDEREVYETKSDGSIVAYSQLEFVFVLERRPIFYVINVILPILLVSFLSCVVFLVPLQSGEKVAYILTLILAHAVLLTLVADSLPHTSITASVLGLFLAFTLFISVLCALVSMLLLNNFHSDEKLDTKSFFYTFTKFIASISNRKSCTGQPKTGNGRNLKKAGKKVSPIITLNDEIPDKCEENVYKIKKSADDAGKYEERVYTRKELTHILDHFCFWVFLTLICICTISFLVALIVGAKSAHTSND